MDAQPMNTPCPTGRPECLLTYAVEVDAYVCRACGQQFTQTEAYEAEALEDSSAWKGCAIS
jgi:transposase-like protein